VLRRLWVWLKSRSISVTLNPGSFMKIEVLHIDGGPHFPATVDAVKRCLGQLGVTCPITEMSVADQNTAVPMGFLGSPTVRINGLDIEPSARQRTAFGMMCRTYDGSGGVPSEDLIRSAMAEAQC
jgi:3'-phosphoadenosine 5'-phosphosulfate sulfotransferase (PAPS reductase)/FAD synthetase